MTNDLERIQVYTLYTNREFLKRPMMKKALRGLLRDPKTKIAIDDPQVFLYKKTGVFVSVIAIWGRFKLRMLMFLPSYPDKFKGAASIIDQAFRHSICERTTKQFYKSNPAPPPKPEVSPAIFKAFDDLNNRYAALKKTSIEFIQEIQQIEKQIVDLEYKQKIPPEKSLEDKWKAELDVKELVVAHAKAYDSSEETKVLGFLYSKKTYDLTDAKKLLKEHQLTFDFANIPAEIERYMGDIRILNQRIKDAEQSRELLVNLADAKKTFEAKKLEKQNLEKQVLEIVSQIRVMDQQHGLGLPKYPEFEAEIPPKSEAKKVEKINPGLVFHQVMAEINKSIDSQNSSYEDKVFQREAQMLYMEKNVKTAKLELGGFESVEISQQKMAVVIQTLSRAMCEPENNEKLRNLIVDIFEAITSLDPAAKEQQATISDFMRFVFGFASDGQPNLDEGYRYRIILFLFASGVSMAHYFFDPASLEPSFKGIKKLEGGNFVKKWLVALGMKLFHGKVEHVTHSILEVPFLKNDPARTAQAKTFIEVFLPIGRKILFDPIDQQSAPLKFKLRKAIHQLATVDYKKFMDVVSFDEPLSPAEMTDACLLLFGNFVKNLASNK